MLIYLYAMTLDKILWNILFKQRYTKSFGGTWETWLPYLWVALLMAIPWTLWKSSSGRSNSAASPGTLQQASVLWHVSSVCTECRYSEACGAFSCMNRNSSECWIYDAGNSKGQQLGKLIIWLMLTFQREFWWGRGSSECKLAAPAAQIKWTAFLLSLW